MAIFNQKGNVLLFVIIGITMIAALGMGMFYMTSTSTLGQAAGSGMNRAYYLALAGKDYALANWNSGLPITGEFILSDTERFELSKTNFKITSTGIVNKDTPFEARKTITAQSPSPVRKHLLDTFENLTNWATGTSAGEVGSHGISADNALDVLSSASAFESGVWSFLQLNATAAGVDLSTPWLDAGRCLSYDLQVKIKNDEPSYMAGLNFKVSNSGNEFYGVSYLRAIRKKTDLSDPNNIPPDLKPPAIWNNPEPAGSNEYSQPAIVLWKRYKYSDVEYKFTWLAYKLLTDADHVVASGYLKAWSNLQVRLKEAYPIGFSNGGPDPLLDGAIIKGATSGATARISGTPILTSETWSVNTASGTLTITNISGTFQNGENLLVNGVIRARVSGAIGAKTNYIRVYYGDVNSHGTQNDIPTDSANRGGNLRIVISSSNVIHWPVDNVSDWSAYYDYMTLAQWDGFQASASRLGGSGTREANAIIGDSSLLTPNSGAINYSGIALHATGNTATSTYFDDFAIQY
jgi:hypothetical protein